MSLRDLAGSGASVDAPRRAGSECLKCPRRELLDAVSGPHQHTRLPAIACIDIPTIREPVEAARHGEYTVADQDLLMRVADLNDLQPATIIPTDPLAHALLDGVRAPAIPLIFGITAMLADAMANPNGNAALEAGFDEINEGIVDRAEVHPGRDDDNFVLCLSERLLENLAMVFRDDQFSPIRDLCLLGECITFLLDAGKLVSEPLNLCFIVAPLGRISLFFVSDVLCHKIELQFLDASIHLECMRYDFGRRRR
jgi:hypothetical protein